MKSLFFMTSTKSSCALFYKEPVYKQLAIQWQIAKQLSGSTLNTIITTETIQQQ